MSATHATLFVACLLCQTPRLIGDDVRDAAVDVSAVKEIFLHRQSGWSVRFFPDGSVQAQYGSLPGDGAMLPRGSVDFGALVRCTKMLRDPAPKLPPDETTSQVGFHDGTETSGIAFCLTNDVLYRYLIQSFSGKWQGGGFGGKSALSHRVEKLLQDHPMFK